MVKSSLDFLIKEIFGGRQYFLFGKSWDNFKNLQKGSPKVRVIYAVKKLIHDSLEIEKNVSLPHCMRA